MYFVLCLLVTLGVVNATLMSVLERTKEFGVMLALGVRRARLFLLVMAEVAVLGALSILAGVIVGAVDRGKLIDGCTIEPGDAVWAFPSSGLHTNGYSLARKIIFEDQDLGIDDSLPGVGRTVAAELLEVHRSYLPEVRRLRESIEIRGLAHITGGGLLENIPRILPDGCSVEIDGSAWETPPVFRFLQERGGIDDREMYRVFNMGIGMIVIVGGGAAGGIECDGCRWQPFPVGRVVEGSGDVLI
jgi:phosphoribosylformylglycinamidine cyclo-ligase